MSSSRNVKRIPAGATVTPFDWGATAAATLAPPPPAPDAPAAAPAEPPVAHAPEPEADVLPPPPPEPPPSVRVADIEREAFAKGYEQGERAGFEAGAKRVEATLRRLAETIDELGNLRRTAIHQMEVQVVRLALEIARRIVHREVSVDRHLAEAMVRVALDRLGATGPITIRLHPDDVAVVSEHVHRGDGSVTLVADSNVSRGGCLVETDVGFVDATIEAQFGELSAALFADDERQLAAVASRG